MPLFQVSVKSELPSHLLRDRYIIPPFSILDSQHGDWLKRRNEWEDIIKNRCENVRNLTTKTNTPYRNKMDYDPGYSGLERNGRTSTFDPFLCEILVKWFSRPNDVILDPFAGGHVRGAISGMLGRSYWGVDLSTPQVLANRENWEKIKSIYNDDSFGEVEWFLGDSLTCEYKKGCNMMLTCPPYYNLEVYSNNPQDLSTCKTYEEFRDLYRRVIARCYDALEDNSFACIVVEELRDTKTGIFYGFVPDTIQAFCDVGFKYYNELILENRIMSLGVRCPKYFDQSRKVGRHHQNVLVFYKGDPKQIEGKFGKFTK